MIPEWTCPEHGSRIDDPDHDGVGWCFEGHHLAWREAQDIVKDTQIKRRLDSKIEGKVPEVEGKASSEDAQAERESAEEEDKK